MPELDFCQIDTKGGGSYCPIGLWPSDKEKGSPYGRPENIHNAKILSAAVVEYLNRLLDLQKEIRATYEAQLIENVAHKVENLGKAQSDISETEAKLLNPGTHNLYYT
jgi:hypothetical protein